MLNAYLFSLYYSSTSVFFGIFSTQPTHTRRPRTHTGTHKNVSEQTNNQIHIHIPYASSTTLPQQATHVSTDP